MSVKSKNKGKIVLQFKVKKPQIYFFAAFIVARHLWRLVLLRFHLICK